MQMGADQSHKKKKKMSNISCLHCSNYLPVHLSLAFYITSLCIGLVKNDQGFILKQNTNHKNINIITIKLGQWSRMGQLIFGHLSFLDQSLWKLFTTTPIRLLHISLISHCQSYTFLKNYWAE